MKPLRILFMTATLVMPVSLHAQVATDQMQQQMMQQLQSMSPEERAAMVSGLMQNAQEIQQCVADAGGEETLKDLQIIGNAHHQQVKNLCQSGKREAAQAYAQDAANELKKDPRVVKLRNCSRIALQNMPQLAQMVETGGIDTSKHVCD
jgi:hypothetical protein